MTMLMVSLLREICRFTNFFLARGLGKPFANGMVSELENPRTELNVDLTLVQVKAPSGGVLLEYRNRQR